MEGMTYTESLLSGANAGQTGESVAAEQTTTETTETTETTTAAETASTATEQTGESTASGKETNETATETPAAEGKFDERTETAFAKRLNAEREKVRAEAMREAQELITRELSPLLEMAQYESKKYNMDPISYAKAVMANQQQAQEQQFVSSIQQIAEEWGLDPRLLYQVAQSHPAVAKATELEAQLSQMQGQIQQKQSLEEQGREFFAAYPDIDAKAIPLEVFEMRDKRGISLLEAYRLHEGTTKTAKLEAEIATLKKALEIKEKNEQNAASAVGSVGGNGSPPPDFISREAFEKNKGNQEWVKQNLDRIQASRRAGKW